jgi:hypothetical protein
MVDDDASCPLPAVISRCNPVESLAEMRPFLACAFLYLLSYSVPSLLRLYCPERGYLAFPSLCPDSPFWQLRSSLMYRYPHAAWLSIP